MSPAAEPLASLPPPTGPLLTGRGLFKRYGRQHALAGVDITVKAGEALGIVGPHGAGKTTLLHVLAAIQPPDSGEVALQGHRIDRLGAAERGKVRRRSFGFVFARGKLVDELTTEENVALPLLVSGVGRCRALAEARTRLERLDLNGLENRRPRELSAGQALRVTLARAFVHGPRIVFADEPADALDVRTGEETVSTLLRAAREDESAVIITTRDRDLVARTGTTMEIREGLITGGVMAA
ncbi:ABC transporter ATP-binding protein [Halosaccharopolyspora lacisalsi]|nr:ATP-binding cassette domain-containing protein [Halosaccharopolyspora lacisalsi]